MLHGNYAYFMKVGQRSVRTECVTGKQHGNTKSSKQNSSHRRGGNKCTFWQDTAKSGDDRLVFQRRRPRPHLVILFQEKRKGRSEHGGRLSAPHWRVLFVGQVSVLRDADDEPVSHFCWCRCCGENDGTSVLHSVQKCSLLAAGYSAWKHTSPICIRKIIFFVRPIWDQTHPACKSPKTWNQTLFLRRKSSDLSCKMRPFSTRRLCLIRQLSLLSAAVTC